MPVPRNSILRFKVSKKPLVATQKRTQKEDESDQGNEGITKTSPKKKKNKRVKNKEITMKKQKKTKMKKVKQKSNKRVKNREIKTKKQQ